MLTLFIDFASLLLAALLVGSMFGARLFLNPTGLDFPSCVAVQQQGIRTLNSFLPVLGAATILATGAASFLARHDRSRLAFLLLSIACFVASGIITRFCNQPINAIVITWQPDAPPSGWQALRDTWWRWHHARLGSGIAGLCFLIVAALTRSSH